MRTCILHIGPHKTATTTLQNWLFANAARLAEDGYYIVKPGSHGSRNLHHELAREFGNDNSATYREQLAHELQNAG